MIRDRDKDDRDKSAKKKKGCYVVSLPNMNTSWDLPLS